MGDQPASRRLVTEERLAEEKLVRADQVRRIVVASSTNVTLQDGDLLLIVEP